uniref:ZT_dimer domain-containing protein n=1 Tax=Panagrellus redivivus TaxID=6233 RepID=A0A7E4UTM4_PANRE
MGKASRSLGAVWSNPAGKRAIFSTLGCALCILYLIWVVNVTRSLVLTGAAWLTIFSFFATVSSVVNIGVGALSVTDDYTYGFVRAPVVAVFSTTVLAQLSAVLQLKEAIESLVAADHHHGPGHGVAVGHALNHYFYSASIATTISLLLSGYSAVGQPFHHVLTIAQSSSLQEHATDISYAICTVFPGVSRFLLPRINAMALLAIVSNMVCLTTHWLMSEYEWFDSVATIVLAVAVFLTMNPLTYYTGMILLQTTPPHIHTQIDRCISEATTVEGVLELKNSHFWQLDFNTIAGTVDVRIRRDADEQAVLSAVTEKLYSVVGELSVQVIKDTGFVMDAVPSYVPQVPTAVFNSHAGHDHDHSHDHAHGHTHGHEVLHHHH